MATVDRHHPDFDAHNLFVLAVTGLVSWANRFDELVTEPAADGPVPSLDPRALVDDPVLCVALGLVALRENLRGHLATIPDASPCTVDPSSSQPRTLRGLLR